MKGRASIEIQAPADKLYEMVSDVTRMGEWSPETKSAEWIGGATQAEPGARFRGHNRRGKLRWSTTPLVKEAVPGKVFSFATQARGQDLTLWSYTFEPAGKGTQVTESFEALRYNFLYRILAPPRKQEAKLQQGIEETLQRLKAAAETA